VYLLVFHAYINEMHGSRSKIPSKKSRPYIYDVKFLALLGAPCIYDISRLRVNIKQQDGNHKLSYMTCNTPVAFYMWPVWLYHTFPLHFHSTRHDTFFKKKKKEKVITNKTCFNFLSSLCMKHFSFLEVLREIQGDQKVSVHLMITVQKTHKNNLNSFNHLP
jgi:hypothetical protein